MRCRYCNAQINVLDTDCSHCGRSLSLLDEGSDRKTDETDSLFEDVSRELDRELAATQKELFSDLDTGRKQESMEKRSEDGKNIGGSLVFKLESLKPAKNFNLFQGVWSGLETTELDIQQIVHFVFFSPHVQSNPLYRQMAGQTAFEFASDIDIVNAVAGENPGDPDNPGTGSEVMPPCIIFLGGLANSTRLAALGLGINACMKSPKARGLFLAIIRSIGQNIVRNRGKFPLKVAEDIFRNLQLGLAVEDGEVSRLARSYAAAMNLAVIAHELGHIALGHTLGMSLNLEISRNQEREADSFAASVASASPFSDHLVTGGIFWSVIETWVEAAMGGQIETTHPYSRDRLMDYIRANRDQAKSLGIDENTIEDFLP